MNWEEYMEAPNELDMTYDDFDDEDNEGRYGRMGEFEDLEDGVIEDELEEDDEDLDTAGFKIESLEDEPTADIPEEE